MVKIIKYVKAFVKDENGLTTAEWVMLASAVTVVAGAVIAVIMPKIKSMANKVGDNLSTDPYSGN